MRILVYEDNLMWSARLLNTLTKLGHHPELRKEGLAGEADAAIVNLGVEALEAERLVPELRSLGVVVIGHAGHKEKDLLALGRAAGCDILATNSELTFKIEGILAKVTAAKG